MLPHKAKDVLRVEINDLNDISAKVQGAASVTPLSVAGGARECLTREGQQFERFT